MKLSIELSRRALVAAQSIVSCDELRYALTGVNLRMVNGRVVIAATDGRRLLVINDDSAKEFSGEKDFNVILRVPKIPLGGYWKTPSILVEIENGKARFTIEPEDSVVETNLVDANFPEWRDVIRFDMKIPAKPALAFSGNLLREFLDAASTYNGESGSNILQVHSLGPQLPFLITTDDANFIGVMMTARQPGETENEFKPFDPPKWITEILEQTST